MSTNRLLSLSGLRNLVRPSPTQVLAVCGLIVLGVAVLDDSILPRAGLITLPLVLALPQGAAFALLIAAAASPAQLQGEAVGPLSSVDVLILGLIARIVLSPTFWKAGRPTLAMVTGVAAVVAGGLATVGADNESEVTASLRVGGYLCIALVLSRTLRPGDLFTFASGVLGMAIGQALAALAGLTPTGATGLPIGRYLGTLGDPNQFGTPVAVALVMLVFSPALIPSRPLRLLALSVLGLALFGSGTRSAWAGALVALVAMGGWALDRRGTPSWARFTSGFVLGALVVVLCVSVVAGASALGLNPVSTQIRAETVSAGWNYLAKHPFLPRGFGDFPTESGIYNTWLALAVALTPITAFLLALFAGIATYDAWGQRLLGLFPALLVIATTTMTENVVQGGSALTLMWFLLLGCGAAVHAETRGTAERRPGRASAQVDG
jgi:hypothetical protein